MSERRRYARVPADLPVFVRILGNRKAGEQSQDSARPDQLVNLSLGGACMVSLKSIAASDVVELHFQLPTAEGPVRVFAEPAWSDDKPGSPSLYGLSFLAVREKDAEKIRKYGESLPPEKQSVLARG